MIACLKGELIFKTPETLVVNVSGVGYEVYFPQRNHRRLPEAGQEVFLHIHTVVREDALDLYGFVDGPEKEMFRLLIGVSGIGPKVAMNILAGATPADIARALSADDVNRLQQLPGVGKKTAERLCLELKDKVAFVPDGLVQDVAAPPDLPEDEERFNDVISALVNLGYPPAKAREALRTVQQDVPAETYAVMRLEELLRHALRSLA